MNVSRSLEITAYSDSDWAFDEQSRKDLTGYIVLIQGTPISWNSKKQPVVAQ